MRFSSTISLMAAGLSLVTTTAMAYYLPFKGEGILYVLASNDDGILGCLAEDGKWTTGDVTHCAINKALGDGFIRDGSDSYYASYYLTVNDNHVITIITDYGDKAVAAWGATEDIDVSYLPSQFGVFLVLLFCSLHSVSLSVGGIPKGWDSMERVTI